MKHPARSEDVMKAGHTHSDHSDNRNAKPEFHFQNLSYEILLLLGHKVLLYSIT